MAKPTTEKQIARWSRRMAKKAGEYRATGQHERAREFVARCAAVVDAIRAARA